MAKPHASTGKGDDGAREKFGLEISRRVRSQVREDVDYPRIARQKGWEGTTQVRLQFGADGKVKSFTVGGSSGYEMLDEKAIEIIKRIQLPPIPDALRSQEFTVQVPIVFKRKVKP